MKLNWWVILLFGVSGVFDRVCIYCYLQTLNPSPEVGRLALDSRQA